MLDITRVPENMDVRAPDMTEVRLLVTVNGGSAIHCTLTSGQVSHAGRHETVEEIWYCLQGEGEVWLKSADNERQEKVVPGVCFSIPVATHFQLCNTSASPLSFVIVTMPPWPGEQEWVRVEDHWPTE